MTSAVAGYPVAPAERVETLTTRGRFPVGLTDDPRIDPARILDRHHHAIRALVDDDPRAVAVIGHPVRLELDDDVRDGLDRKQPVAVCGIEPIRDVGQPNRHAALEPGKQVDHPQRGEGIATLGDGRRLDVRIRQAAGCRPEWPKAGCRGANIGHDESDLRVIWSGLGREA